MPVAKKRGQTSKSKWTLHSAQAFLKDCMLNPNKIWILAFAMIIFELVLNTGVILRVKYTEIDWKAYMEEVEGFINGTRDYTQLKGGTGPLVYPAGFVYLFSGLYHLTSHGENIRLAQFIFMGFYIINLILVIRLYHKTAICPPYVLFFICCMSYRIHSIFVLRLFNDPVAMIFLYAAINMFVDKQWAIGCLLFSLGVSIKMNVLLFAPALLIILLYENGILNTAAYLLLCLLVQIILGLPFLLVNPKGYLVKSFELGRQFFYIWTVNWRCIPENIFLDQRFQIMLLIIHLAVLFCFAAYKWMPNLPKLFQLINPYKYWKNSPGKFSSLHIILMLFCSNFIGMCFSRSLHYQFYIWYYHTLPVLLWASPISTKFRLLLLGVIEMAWNTYPSTVYSSISLHVAHAILLTLIWSSPHWKQFLPKRNID